jgi:hypothetical protein
VNSSAQKSENEYSSAYKSEFLSSKMCTIVFLSYKSELFLMRGSSLLENEVSTKNNYSTSVVDVEKKPYQRKKVGTAEKKSGNIATKITSNKICPFMIFSNQIYFTTQECRKFFAVGSEHLHKRGRKNTTRETAFPLSLSLEQCTLVYS